MNRKDIAELLKEEIARRGMTHKDAGRLSDIDGTHVSRFLKHHDAFSFESTLKLLDGLGLQFSIEDKGSNWGLDKRLKIMPRTLYTGARVEARTIIREHGFDPRVDLFESPEQVLMFIPKPCDIYEIFPDELIKSKFELVDHPFGTMYSYSGNISPDLIESRTSHR